MKDPILAEREYEVAKTVAGIDDEDGRFRNIYETLRNSTPEQVDGLNKVLRDYQDKTETSLLDKLGVTAVFVVMVVLSVLVGWKFIVFVISEFGN